jgi:hypothetical protein
MSRVPFPLSPITCTEPALELSEIHRGIGALSHIVPPITICLFVLTNHFRRGPRMSLKIYDCATHSSFTFQALYKDSFYYL